MFRLRASFIIPLLALVATYFVGAPPPAIAQEGSLPYVDQLPPLVDREIFFGNPEISGGELSPDGRWVSFLRELDNKLNVWVKAIDEPFDAAHPVTADTARPVVNYFWSEDGKWILYAQDKAGDENYRVYAVDPTAAPAAGSKAPAARDLTPYENVQARIVAVPENDPAHILVALNDRNPQLHDVYRVNLATGERELVIQNDANVAGWVADLEGSLRLGIRIDENGNTEVLRVDGDSLPVVYTCSPEETCGPIRYHKDGRRVYMITNKGDVDLMRLILFDPRTHAEELVESDPENEVDISDALFSETTEELIATAYMGDRIRWYPKSDEFARDLERTREELPEGDLGFRSMIEDGKLMLVSVSSDVDPSATYVYDREAGTFELLYRTRPDVPTEHMASMRPVRYTARDGVEIPGYLTVPKGVEAKNLAVVVMPHGGPWSRDAWGFDNTAQFLANRGYAVLMPNFRGSTGYGKRFLNLGNDQWGTGTMQHDLSDGVEWLVEQGIADPEKVAIMGGSYGGYATLAGVAFTPELYAAGVDIVGPSNIITLLESIPPYWKPIQAIFSVRVGDPNDPADVERMRAQSPLFAADRIEAPLLVIQGANDPRVKQRESDQIVIAMRENDRPVEYLVAPDEGHGFLNEENNLAMFAKIEEFLAEHLGGRYQHDVPPPIAERLAGMTVDVATVEITPVATATGETIDAFDGDEVEPGSLRYHQTVNVMGRNMEFDATRTVAQTTWDGQAVLAIVQENQSPMGAAVDSTFVDAVTLRPLKRVIRQGPAIIEMTFRTDSVVGKIEAGPQTLPIQAASEGVVFVSGAPLEIGFATIAGDGDETATIHLFDVFEGKVREYAVEIGDEEAIETPAGSIGAITITLTPTDGSPGGQTIWIEKAEPHRVVKVNAQLPAQVGGGTATMTLAGADQ
jgi:dipeptidyl aminopeptidase/acylaminoacyl peptidase